MDGSAFDRLSRVFGTAGSRRDLLALLSGLPLAGVRLGGGDVAGKPGPTRFRAQPQRRHTKTQRRQDHRDDTHSEACIPTGQACPARKARGKKGKRLGCSKCCQGSFITEASGKKVWGAHPKGGAGTTESASSCCSGFCDGSTCQAAPCSAAIPCPQ